MFSDFVFGLAIKIKQVATHHNIFTAVAVGMQKKRNLFGIFILQEVMDNTAWPTMDSRESSAKDSSLPTKESRSGLRLRAQGDRPPRSPPPWRLANPRTMQRWLPGSRRGW